VRNNDEDILNAVTRELRRVVRLSTTFDARVMETVRELPRHGRRVRLWLTLTTPQTFTVKPLRWGVLAASLVLFAAFGVVHTVRAVDNSVAPRLAEAIHGKKTPPSQRVQFVLVAPSASKVAVVGDFNGWDATHSAFQAHHRGGGVWSVTAAVPFGHHRYSFVIDDSLWMADPTAPRVMDNDYGLPNSALVVGNQ